jgi:uncharacterized RDD family membrane protein YckC
MKLEVAQKSMGWVMAGLLPLGILSFFFPSLERVFLIVFGLVVVYSIWEKEKQLERSREEVRRLKDEIESMERRT